MKKRMLAYVLAILLILGSLAGCGSKDEENTSETISPTVVESQGGQETSNDQKTELTVQVTKVDGDTVTAVVGELSEGSNGQGNPPEMPEGSEGQGNPPEMPEGSEGQGNPPEMPEGSEGQGNPPEMPEGSEGQGNPPEMPEGSEGQGNPPQGMGGTAFVAGEETITFKVTDATVITIEYLQGTDAGTIEQITEHAVLVVSLNAANEAETITVKNLNRGNGFGGSAEVTNGTAAETISEDGSRNEQMYQSSGDDENALRIDGAKVTLTGITLDKSGGESSNTENGDFYGQNAGLLALNGAEVTITDSEFHTNAVNGNAVFSYGEGTVVNISNSVICTEQNNSGGIQTTGGGTMNAENLTVQTAGNSAAAIRSDRGGGTVNVTGGTYETTGTGSPAIYCTADIQVKGAVLSAENSEGIVVEGKNSVALTDCEVTGSMKGTYNGNENENLHGIMIYQSMSGDAAVGKAAFSATGGSLTTTCGDLFYVTNTSCTITLDGTELNTANDVLLRVAGNDASRGWGTKGANGGNVVLTTANQELNGQIIVDEISECDFTMQDKTVFTGTINTDGQAGDVAVTMEAGAAWTLTGDSYVTAFDGDLSQVQANGYHLYVNGEAVL